MNFQKPGSDPGEQKRLLLAVVLSAAVLFIWQFFMPAPPAVDPQAPVSGAPGSGSPGSVAAGSVASAGAPGSVPAAAPVSIERRTLATLAVAGRHTITLTNDDGQIATWDLEEAQYRETGANGEAQPYRMVRPLAAAEASKGFFLPPRLEVEAAGRPIRGDYTVVEQGERKAVLAFTDPSGLKITRSWELAADDYTIQTRVIIENPGATSVTYGLQALVPGVQNDAEAGGSMFSPPVYAFKAICRHAEDLEHQPVGQVLNNQTDPDEAKAWANGVTWGGVDNRYFMTAVLPPAGEAETCAFAAGSAVVGGPALPSGYSLVQVGLKLKGGEIPAGGRVERSLELYVGPKKLDALKAQSPSLEETVDLGWFPIIGLPMLWLMQVFYGFMANWGLAIILLTIVVKLLTLPLTHKQYKSMAAMKKLQPQLKALQTKFAEDKPRLQQEMMKLYKENKVNPLAGCLPMLLMMPIYVSLYQTIYSAVELYRADFVFWINDLSERDPYFIWPLLLGALFFVQMRLNPSVSDNPQQKLIMNIMPIMFTAMMLFLPSGLVIYIFVNTILGLVQQLVLYKKEAEQPPAPPPAGARRRAA